MGLSPRQLAAAFQRRVDQGDVAAAARPTAVILPWAQYLALAPRWIVYSLAAQAARFGDVPVYPDRRAAAAPPDAERWDLEVEDPR